jgi:hypothetical protein
MPLYWFYSKWLRTALMRSWRKRLPAWWSDYIGTTRVLSRRKMAELFPNGETRLEYSFGFPKSYVSHSREWSPAPGRRPDRGGRCGGANVQDCGHASHHGVTSTLSRHSYPTRTSTLCWAPTSISFLDPSS